MKSIPRSLIAKAKSAGFAIVIAWLGTVTAARAATVTVDARTAFQRMDGFGSSERVFDDPHVYNNFNPATSRSATILTTAQQDAVLDRLYVDLKLTRVRPAQPDSAVETPQGLMGGIEPVNDNADPNVTDLSKFDFAWKKLDAHMDYLQRARQRGVTTYFLSPLYRESWMRADTLNDAAEYAEWLLAQALRCQALGVALPYLSVANEPSARNPMDGAFIRDVIKILGPKLRAAGLNTLFVVPDEVRSSAAAANTQTILADAVARSYVGALATHLYDEPITNVGQMKALSQQYGLPLWMTEFSLPSMGTAGLGNGPFDWADLMHQLIATYDVSAVDLQWGCFGQWEGGTQYVTLNYDQGGTEAYTGYTLNKLYYVTGQYSRFIAPGARRIQCVSDDANVKVSAYVDWPNVTIVAVNNTAGNLTAAFSLAGLPAIGTMNAVRTSDTENWASLAAINVVGSTFTAGLEHASVTTFTATLPPLKLNIARTGNNVTLSWPVGAAGYILQTTPQLSPAPTWSDVTSVPSVVGGEKRVTLPVASERQFYRLLKP